MPNIRTANEHVPAVQWNTGAIAMTSLQNELRILVKPLVSARNQLDCSVLDNRVDDRDVGDHEVARKWAVDVVMLRVASWEIEIAANVWHAKDFRVQLFEKVDDSALL